MFRAGRHPVSFRAGADDGSREERRSDRKTYRLGHCPGRAGRPRITVMNRLNVLFSLTSLSVVLVTVERFSFTRNVLLPPHHFLRLHELVQMTVVILLTVVVPALVLRVVSGDFAALRTRAGGWLFLAFVIGVYFYATGNGVHEMASFVLGTSCNPDHATGDLCGGLFVNDFYTGNILYFLGAFLFTASILVLERMNPSGAYRQGGLTVLVVNAVIFAVTVLAYAGFDRVLVGLVYSLAMTVFVLACFLPVRRRFREYPFTTYTTIVYVLGTAASLLARLA